MARIVIASNSETWRTQLSRILTGSGFNVFRCCDSGGELRRIINDCDGAIVILAGTISNCLPDDLILDYGNQIQLLLAARPPVLESCENPDIFKLKMPCSGQEVIGAVEMLLQLQQRKAPRRSREDRQVINEAKALLMRTLGLSEADAHRFLQKQAMNKGIKMADYAEKILENGKKS